ncbi:MAG: tRNA pseudouridine(13) synthase TruD [Methylococcaceae bacterium]|nr:tRNA pseudouridine(13) synthase TruD [Methylococcaceae bacterium]
MSEFGVESARRALRLFAKDLNWRFEAPNDLWLNFVLPAGGYATSVLRELLNCTE